MAAQRESASTIMQRLNADPLKYIVRVFNGLDDGDPEKLKAAYELLPYAYPKLRPKDPDQDNRPKQIEIVIGSIAAKPRARGAKRGAKV